MIGLIGYKENFDNLQKGDLIVTENISNPLFRGETYDEYKIIEYGHVQGMWVAVSVMGERRTLWEKDKMMAFDIDENNEVHQPERFFEYRIHIQKYDFSRELVMWFKTVIATACLIFAFATYMLLVILWQMVCDIMFN